MQRDRVYRSLLCRRTIAPCSHHREMPKRGKFCNSAIHPDTFSLSCEHQPSFTFPSLLACIHYKTTKFGYGLSHGSLFAVSNVPRPGDCISERTLTHPQTALPSTKPSEHPATSLPSFLPKQHGSQDSSVSFHFQALERTTSLSS